MVYTRNILSSHSHEQYWNYWIQKVDFTNTQHTNYPGSVVMNYLMANDVQSVTKHQYYYDGHEPMEQMMLLWNNDLPLLFLKHEQIMYCCFIILSSVGILYYVHGVKLWEKY